MGLGAPKTNILGSGNSDIPVGKIRLLSPGAAFWPRLPAAGDHVIGYPASSIPFVLFEHQNLPTMVVCHEYYDACYLSIQDRGSPQIEKSGVRCQQKATSYCPLGAAKNSRRRTVSRTKAQLENKVFQTTKKAMKRHSISLCVRSILRQPSSLSIRRCCWPEIRQESRNKSPAAGACGGSKRFRASFLQSKLILCS